MTRAGFSGAARVAGVVGAPVRQSLSPMIHNAWIAEAGLDAIYIPVSPSPSRFSAFVESLRGGSIVGLNVTLPFKQAALSVADTADAVAEAAGASNLLLFHSNGRIEARNTDGVGLLEAFDQQAPGWRPGDGPVVVLGAGGAARGAAAALTAAGAVVRIVNRTHSRAVHLAAALPQAEAVQIQCLPNLLSQASAIVNATSAGLEGLGTLDVPLHLASDQAVVMDMVYKPVRTHLLQAAAKRGLRTVDGLAMLIGQARPSFEAFFGQPAPTGVDVRKLALRALGEADA